MFNFIYKHVITLRRSPWKFVISLRGMPIIFEEKRNNENCSNLYGVREFVMRKTAKPQSRNIQLTHFIKIRK
jgi:hypothetical protein